LIILTTPENVIVFDGKKYKQIVERVKKIRIIDGGIKDPDKGYSWWDDHKYIKRSVENNFDSWCGIDRLLSIINRLGETTKSLFCVTYETGGRAMEVLSLRPEQFKVDKKQGIVTVQRMMVEKLRKSKDKTRTFPILLSSPLIEPILDVVNNTKIGEPLFPYGYAWMYKRIRNIEKEEGDTHGPWWCHRIRAEKASSLVVEHNFGVIELMDYFGWKRVDTPRFYAKLSPQDLINKILKGEV
jgi:integrase